MNDDLFGANTDEYAFPFSDEATIGAMQKLQSALSGSGELKAYAANVLIGNIPAKKVNESVGCEFKLCGFHAKKFTYKESKRDGVYTIMFGISSNDKFCAYCCASEKIYESLLHILYVYGDISRWGSGISVKIRMNDVGDVKAYCLEIIG
jgi:hypothetical protein